MVSGAQQQYDDEFHGTSSSYKIHYKMAASEHRHVRCQFNN